ncbi:MAG: winged helix-turn-helix domain-containing protein [Betaproteobacteria bacterium]|nr:winged helix-turn-helix domain-containing protein [Betaproteobacteria bacterium]
MDVLVALASRAPEPVSRAELLDTVWAGAVVTDGVISRCISLLRDSVGDDRVGPRFIETLSKKGYRLVPPVSFAGERGTGGASTGRTPPTGDGRDRRAPFVICRPPRRDPLPTA